MNISKEEKKKEAVFRMMKLGVFYETLRQFKEDGHISRSDPPFGAFYWVEDEELEAIRKFEEKYNALVYLVVRSYTSIGMMDCYLYVSDHKEEWELDLEDIDNNEPFVYVVNHDDPNGSEFGRIGIKRTVAAGIKRVW